MVSGGLVVSKGECIGYAPHVRQRVNTGDQFYQVPGTIFIQHCPRRAPLAFGTYEVEVTGLGPTEYSLVVLAGQGELCASLLDKRLEEARQLKVGGPAYGHLCLISHFNFSCRLHMETTRDSCFTLSHGDA